MSWSTQLSAFHNIMLLSSSALCTGRCGHCVPILIACGVCSVNVDRKIRDRSGYAEVQGGAVSMCVAKWKWGSAVASGAFSERAPRAWPPCPRKPSRRSGRGGEAEPAGCHV
mmetsp:Transcript_48735/g.104427  ORF Transcript_48735/g.104427 Transcript_48735/m.104427 type:complete len:112 (-) Transcript_48735:27-362(-)|eukprot:scaffold1702_cov27-Tisochrysis_lutea.AAC.1